MVKLRFIRPNDMGSNKKKKKVVYISPIRHAEGLLYLNAVLEKPELYEQMLSVLKDYDEDIISINYDNVNVTGGAYTRSFQNLEKSTSAECLRRWNEKAVLLMSAVIAAEDGVLLIDEFETAIHTSAMKNTFRWIWRHAKN